MRVLVASRSPDLATILSVAGYEVLDGRPGDARDWVDRAELPATDVLVVDLAMPAASEPLVALAVSSSRPTPVVTIADEPRDHASDLVHHVVRPLSRDILVAAIETVTKPAAPVEVAPVEVAPVEVAPVEPAPVEAAAERTAEPTQQHAGPAAPTPAAGPPSTATVSYANLTRQVATEMTVAEVCSEVCALVTDAGRADAAALLVRDEERWRVAGGSGLRDLEHRIELERSHWLIGEMLSAVKGAVIDHSDVARQHMHNVPVASRDQLAFVTDKKLEAVLVVGRSERPFTDDDLVYLQGVVREAEPHVLHALEVRALARALDRFRDEA